MQTARVTILMAPEKKAAFDALAAERGVSTGEFFRQAGDRAAAFHDQEEEALALLIDELEQLLPAMHQKLDDMHASIASARAAIHESLAAVEATKRPPSIFAEAAE
jgi:hypothetical protein